MFHHSEQQLPTALNSYPDCPEFPENLENPDTLESPENRKPSGLSDQRVSSLKTAATYTPPSP